MLDRKDVVALAVLTVLALAVRLAFLQQIKVQESDETYYIGMAAGMGEGRFYDGFDPEPFRKSPMTKGKHQGQPLIPFLFMIVGKLLGGRWVAAAQTVSLSAFLLSIPFFYASLRQIASRRESFLSTLLLVLAPFSIHYSLPGLTLSVYIFFLCMFFFFATRALIRGSLVCAALAGASLFGAYATRDEAFFLFIYFIPVGALALLRTKSSRALKAGVIFIITFVLLSLPVWIWIRQTTGIWQLDWDLSGRAENFIKNWQTSSGKLGAQIFLYLPVSYIKRLLHAWATLIRVFPLPVWMLSLLGAVGLAVRSRESFIWTVFWVLCCAFPFLFYPLFETSPVYFYSALGLILLGAGPGAALIEAGVRSEKSVPARYFRGLWITLTGLCLVGFLPGYRSLVLDYRQEPLEMRRLGEWVRNEDPTPRTFLTTDRRPCFYAGPACGRLFTFRQLKRRSILPRELENFIKQEKIDWVVADTRYLPKYFPEFYFLLDSPPAFLEKRSETTVRGERAVLYHTVQP